ncbi:hypothetical protein [Demequina litorisediminis]|uniref:hypothetical protein n=1 Tax=Demequina litorisediminis TaxID=1849022 RepID=UPI0024E0DAC9|nr:hypothetical protein [Demequina litorisediminis]
MDGFWEDEHTDWPSFAPVHFHYSTVRDDLSVGADLREALDGVSVDDGAIALKDDSAVPFATCEARRRHARRLPPPPARHRARRRGARPREDRLGIGVAGLLHVLRRHAARGHRGHPAGEPRHRLPQRRPHAHLRLPRTSRRARPGSPAPPPAAPPAPVAAHRRRGHRRDGEHRGR